MTWFQVWFWLTIVTVVFIGFELWRAPLMPSDYDPEDVDRLHESTVRIIENRDGT